MKTPTLDGLPVELQIAILLRMPDIETLRSIVFASPSYHQSYRMIRKDALLNVLRAEYHSLLDISEAIAAIRSRGLLASIESNVPKIYALLDARRRAQEIRDLGLPTSPLPDEPTDVTEIVHLFRLHRIALWLLDDYCHNASCPEWMDSTRWSDEILPLSFSQTEKQRYFRAFYRIQTHCNIFGVGQHPVDHDDGERYNWWLDHLEEREMWQMFFGPLKPWEISEFGCLWYHFYDRNAVPYYEIAYDMGRYDTPGHYPRPPDLALRPSQRVCSFDTLIAWDDSSRESLASVGPCFLFKLLSEKVYRARRDLVLAHANYNWDAFPDGCPGAYGLLPLLYPADRFNFGPDVIGLQEFLATLPDSERPNIAWETTWLCTPLKLYYDNDAFDLFLGRGVGGLLSTHERWKWGYALWDDKRLLEWGAPMEPEKLE